MALSDEGALVDKVLITLRWWGPYQQVQFLMAMAPVVGIAFHAMSVVFIGRMVEHRCAPLDQLYITVEEDGATRHYDVLANQSVFANFTVMYEECNIHVRNGTGLLHTTSCVAGYEYAEPIERSYVSEYDLVCDREALSDFAQTMLALGMSIGAFLFAAIADRYGRKPTYMGCHLMMFVTAVVIAFAPNFVTYAILRLLLGGFQQGTALVSCIMMIELLPKEKRALPSLVSNFVWVGSLMLLCLVAYLTKDINWRYTELIFAAASFFVLFQWWISDESLRWLVTNKRHSQIQQVLKKAARTNNVDFEAVRKLLYGGLGHVEIATITDSSVFSTHSNETANGPVDQKMTEKTKEFVSDVNNGDIPAEKTAPKEKMRLMAFLKNKRVFMTTAISCFMWLTVSMTYYGLLLTSSSLAESLHLGVFLSVMAELPVGFVFIFAINRLGRKRFLMISQVLAGLTLLAATLLSNIPVAADVPGIRIIIVSVTLLGKFAVSTAFAILWLYTAELYPTNLRNTGFGLSSLAARVGGMIAPYSRTFGRHVPWGPGAVFTCLCLLVPFVLQLLPETVDKELPQTLDDLDKMFEAEKKQRRSKETQKNLPC